MTTRPDAIPEVHAGSGEVPWLIRLRDDGGHEWLGDEPAESGGGDLGPSPSRLIMSGLGACTAITVQMYAQRKQWPLTGIEVDLQLNPGGKPESGNDITRRITLHGALDAEQRARLLQIANACPMHKLLTGEVRIASSLTA